MPRYFKKARQINNLKVIDGLVRESWLDAGQHHQSYSDALKRANHSVLWCPKAVYAAAVVFRTESAIRKASYLILSEIQQFTQIWLEPISPDSDLRTELRGWYQVKNITFKMSMETGFI